jgi:hypothetical protein
MNPADTAIDPARCPLCGTPNRCAMELERASGQPQPPCWCTQASFPPPLLEQLPPETRGKACICAACAARAALPGDGF